MIDGLAGEQRPYRSPQRAALLGAATVAALIAAAAGGASLWSSSDLHSNSPAALRSAAESPQQKEARRAVATLYSQIDEHLDTIERVAENEGIAGDQARSALQHLRTRLCR